MADFLEDFGLRHEGFTDEQIAQIDNAKEDLMHVVATIQAIWPRITRLIPVANMIAETIAKHQKGIV